MSKYTNSPLVTYTNITDKKTKRKGSGVIDTITIHCFVGQVTAKQGVDYFKNTDTACSSNYVVGKDGSIGQSVEEEFRAWTSGGKDKNGNPIRVNGISGADNDHRAVTIEVASSTKSPYTVTEEAYNALIRLCADICKRNKIDKLLWEGDKSLVGHIDRQNMTVHRWFANKSCPGDYLYNKHSDIANSVNCLLEEEKEMIIKCPHCGKDIKVEVTKVNDVAPQAPQKPSEPRKYKVNDIVTFKGKTQYKSSDALTGYSCESGEAKITYISKSGKHPYHLVKTGKKGPYGWVDEGSFE